MKYKVIFAIILSIFIFGKYTYSQDTISEPYDIREYFLLIPDHFIKIEKNIRKEILKNKTVRVSEESESYYRLDTLDYENAYMRFQIVGDGEGIIFEITYYILKNKERIIAVHFIGWSRCCEDSFIIFFKIKDNNWTDITSSVLPEIKLSDFYFGHKYAKSAKSKLYLRYYIPQKGKNIRVKLADTFFEYMNDEDYFKLKGANKLQEIELVWNNGNFLIKK